MKPGEFSAENASAMFSDEQLRALTAEARQFAAEGKPPRQYFGTPATYWDAVLIEHKRLVWFGAYRLRLARIARLQQ